MWTTTGHGDGQHTFDVVPLADDLTGLLTRPAIYEAIEEIYDSITPCSLALVNIDGLRQHNDDHGVATGDAIVAEIGHRLRSLVETALVARVAGDEFLIFSPGFEGRRLASQIVESARAPLAIDDLGSGKTLSVTVSAGIAFGPEHGNTFNDLLYSAEHALRRAKLAGGDQARSSILRSLQAHEIAPASQQLAATVRELIGILSTDGQADHRPWVNELVRAYEDARNGGREAFRTLGEMDFTADQPMAVSQNARCMHLRDRVQDLTIVLGRGVAI